MGRLAVIGAAGLTGVGISAVQRFVRTAELDHVYDAVATTIASTDVSSLSYQAVAIGHADWGVPGQGLAAIVVQPNIEVLAFQAALLEAVTPYTEAGGTAAAVVRDPGEDVSQSTCDWVDGYVPGQIGDGHYIAHITVGFATLDDLEEIEDERFDSFPVRPPRASRCTTSATAARPAPSSRTGRCRTRR